MKTQEKFQTLFLGKPFTPLGKMICHFYRGGGGGLGAGRVLRPEVKPLPFYTAFPAEKLPFSYTFLDKWYHFHVPSLERCILFLL